MQTGVGAEVGRGGKLTGRGAEESSGEGRRRGGGLAGLPYMAVDELYANIGLRVTASRFCRQSVVAFRV